MARAEELGVARSAGLPARGRRDQQAPPGPRGRPGPGAARRRRSPARRSRVLGAAFKPNSDDVRDSPALDVAAAVQQLGRRGARLRPGGDGQRPAGATRSWRTAESALEAARGADVVLLLTEWAEFREMDPAKLAGWWPRRGSWTAATRSTRPPGARRAGPTARSAAPEAAPPALPAGPGPGLGRSSRELPVRPGGGPTGLSGAGRVAGWWDLEAGRPAAGCPKRMVHGPCGGVRADLSCELGDRPCPFATAPPVPWPARRRRQRPARRRCRWC